MNLFEINWYFGSFISLILGVSSGSFISVLIHRLMNEEKGILFGKSHCPHCQKNLKPQHLIPLFSFIFLQGKCAFCKKPISWNYFLFELTTGIVFTLLYFFFSQYSLSFLPWIILYFQSIILLTLAFTDLKYQAVPNVLLILSGVVFTISHFVFSPNLWQGSIPLIQELFGQNSTINLASGAIGVVISLLLLLPQIIFSKGKWLGSGDIYFAFPVAFWLGWPLTIAWLTITYLLGGVVAIILLITGRVGRKSSLAFLPFLIVTIYPIALFGDQLINWYFN